MINVVEQWDKGYKNINLDRTKYDLWLDKYTNILEKTKDTPIIDLGCGTGNNSLYLVERGYKVISCDFSEEALKIVKNNVPGTDVMHFDMTKGLPFDNEITKVVIADLCLHYFYMKDTIKLVNDIKRVLKASGYLFCRVNSVNDTAHGAGQGEKLEENFYIVKNKYKRFFNKEQLEEVFAGWKIHYMNEYVSERHKDKYHWEVAIEK